MGGYVLNFTVYTLAMSGLIFFALFVYKKIMSGNFHTNNSKQLSIEEVMNINPRKSLMIVKAGEERFLIASDVDKTTLISKLESANYKTKNIIEDNFKSYSEYEGIPEESDSNESLTNNIEKVNFGSASSVMDNISALYPQESEPHFEIITEKNPSSIRRNSYNTKNYAQKQNKTVEIDTSLQPKSHGLSTIKDMAAKINEI